MNPRELFQHNREAVKRRDPLLARQLSEHPFDQSTFVITQSNDRQAILAIRQPNGQAFALDDLHSPLTQAQAWVEHLGKDFLVGAPVLLLGFGSGYHPERFVQSVEEDSLVWIVEPDLNLLRAAFHVKDFSSLLRSPNIRLVAGRSEKEVAQILFQGVEANRTRAQGIRMAVPPYAKSLYPVYIQNLSKAIGDAIQTDRLKFRTEEVQGRIIAENIVKNFPWILQGAPIIRLQSKGAGIPAFVVSPGPSLGESLTFLKDVQPYGLILAVDTAYRILQKQGIHPDLVVSLDFTPLNAKHFETITENETLLASHVGVDSAIVTMFQKKTFFYTTGANKLLQAIPSMGTLGEFQSIGSTSHTTYSIARMMGCSPIILIGQDLSFPEDRRYTDGAMQLELDVSRKNEVLLEVPSNNGGMVQTSRLYKIFLDEFHHLVQQTAGWTINTSQHGAKINHVEVQPLKNLFQWIPPKPIDKRFLLQSLDPPIARNLNLIKKEIHELRRHCERIQSELKHLEEKTDSLDIHSGQFNQDMKTIHESLQCLLKSHPHVFTLCTTLCPRSTVSLVGWGQGIGKWEGLSDWHKGQLKERTHTFFNDYIQALQFNLQLLEQLESIENTF